MAVHGATLAAAPPARQDLEAEAAVLAADLAVLAAEALAAAEPAEAGNTNQLLLAFYLNLFL